MKNFVAAVVRTRSLRRSLTIATAVALIPLTVWALNPNAPPGTNFNMTYWSLQLPTGTPGSPDTISSSQLQQGYQDPNHQYFFTESGDGAMVMKVPQFSSCVTTPNSQHCRTELREVNPSNGSAAAWYPSAATNRLKATVAVTVPSEKSVVVGQIHFDDSVSTKPVCELYYDSNGDVKIGIQDSADPNATQHTPQFLTNIPVGQSFTYEIEFSSNALKVAINNTFTTLPTYSIGNQKMYFKAGDYDQGNNPGDVHFTALTIQH